MVSFDTKEYHTDAYTVFAKRLYLTSNLEVLRLNVFLWYEMPRFALHILFSLSKIHPQTVDFTF